MKREKKLKPICIEYKNPLKHENELENEPLECVTVFRKSLP